MDILGISCPECGEPVESIEPQNFIVPGVRPLHRHVSDGTPLCPVMIPHGYRPGQPVEHLTAGS
jgi:hypothetical protein